MHLADHIRPLLRDHDCVIIPDFGGLVADAAPARLQPGRQVFSPPAKLVAFNQALTRNDGLLVDALAQHTGLSIAQAREAVRQAVAELQHDLQQTNRTELPGIGIFRQAAGRGLSFEYTGSDNLLPAAFGLPEVVARPVMSTNARVSREKSVQPVLRTVGAKRSRLARVLPVASVALVAVLLVAANYLGVLQSGAVFRSGRVSPGSSEQVKPAAPLVAANPMEKPQQATLAQQAWADNGEAAVVQAPAELPGAASAVPGLPAVGELASADSTTAADSWAAEAAPAEEAPIAVAPAAVEAPAPKVLTPSKPAVAKAAAAKPAAMPTAPVVAAAKPVAAAKGATTVKARTGRFYVISAAFRTLVGAEKVRKAIKGGTARILLPPPGSRLFRLSVADFADKAAAEAEARRLRTKARSTNSHLVLNY